MLTDRPACAGGGLSVYTNFCTPSTLAQLRGFVAATVRSDAMRDARLLSLVATATRGDARHLDQTFERLTDQALNHAHRHSHR